LDTGFFHVLKSILQKGIYWNLFIGIHGGMHGAQS